MKKHFILTEEFKINSQGVKLFRIQCIRKIPAANIGDLGGFIEKEENLSGNAWVGHNAEVFGNAWVFEDAKIYGNAKVSEDAKIYGNARVSEYAKISGTAHINGNLEITDEARVSHKNDYCCFQGFGSKGRTTSVFREKGNKIKIICGCFKGTIEEFEKAVEETHGNNQSAKEYKAIINVIKVKFIID